MNLEDKALRDLVEKNARLEARIEEHSRRIAKNEDLTAHIHELAASVRSLSGEVKGQNDRMEKVLTSIEASQAKQGERIGELEKKGSKKLESIIATIVTVLVTAVVMYFVGSIGA